MLLKLDSVSLKYVQRALNIQSQHRPSSQRIVQAPTPALNEYAVRRSTLDGALREPSSLYLPPSREYAQTEGHIAISNTPQAHSAGFSGIATWRDMRMGLTQGQQRQTHRVYHADEETLPLLPDRWPPEGDSYSRGSWSVAESVTTALLVSGGVYVIWKILKGSSAW